MKGPSLRDLAHSLGLSTTTVSDALRDRPNVRPATRQRVKQAAEEAGYHYNPLAGALMSEMRRSRGNTFRGTLAILDVDGPSSRIESGNRFHEALVRGATKRAAELGFKTERFSLDREGISFKRLNTILQARGINGILLLPIGVERDLTQFDWSRYAAVYSDYILHQPSLHTVSANHYRSMRMLLDRIRERKYRRPGLVLKTLHDERLLHRWHSAFLGYCYNNRYFEQCPPPLIVPRPDKTTFLRWFEKTKPDVVLYHDPAVMGWMKEAGAKIPETHGFCCLNTSMTSVACAGLDLQPGLLGARGMELLIAQIYHNEFGPPEIPSTTSIIAAWKDGPTLRALP